MGSDGFLYEVSYTHAYAYAYKIIMCRVSLMRFAKIILQQRLP